MTDKLTRRGSLLKLGGLVAGAIGVGGLESEPSEGAGPAAVASGAVSCVLTPEQTLWQQALYQWAFTEAQAVVQPSLPERDLLAVWN